MCLQACSLFNMTTAIAMLTPAAVVESVNASSHGLHIVNLCRLAGVRYEGREVHGLQHTVGTRSYLQTGDILEARDLL